MSEGWRDSGQMMRSLGEWTDILGRGIMVVADMARDHADCEPLLVALDTARRSLVTAEAELHSHARAFEEAARLMDERHEHDI